MILVSNLNGIKKYFYKHWGTFTGEETNKIIIPNVKFGKNKDPITKSKIKLMIKPCTDVVIIEQEQTPESCILQIHYH